MKMETWKEGLWKEGLLVNESTEAVEVKQNVLIKNHSLAHG